MKIRNGFVSNSSSSSFCINVFGSYINITEDGRHSNVNKDFIEIISKAFSNEEAESLLSNFDLVTARDIEILEDYVSKHSGLDCLCLYDQIIVGVSPEELKDDETGRQFKERIHDRIKKVFPNSEIKVEYIELQEC